ncbi:MAG: PAS domain S-box protein [Desulfobacterota bacterium]|jgi:PAS domain S-box-containing protein|nr:PAS domain S-box protein [Thermodesulfobacteriota bacterium]
MKDAGQSRELTIFRRINEAISLSPDVEAVANAILEIIIDETPAENASIMMPGLDGSQLEIKAAKGRRDRKGRYSEKSLGQVFIIGQGIAGMAAITRKAIIIHDTAQDPRFEARDNKVSIGSILSLPMIYSRNELVGVLNLSHPEADSFEEDDLVVLSALLSPAALALRNARLMREVDEINKMLKAELSITDKAMMEFGRSILKVFNWMAIGVLTTDSKGIISTINKRATDMLGKKAGQSLADIVGNELIQKIVSDKEGLSQDVEKGGRIFCFDLSPLPLKPSWQVVACIRDVTVERFKEKELVRVKDQYKDMVEKAIDAVYIIKNGRFLLINRKFQEMLGYEQDEILNRHFRHVLPRDSVHALAEALRTTKGNIFVPNLEIQALRKDGQKIYLEISIGRIMIDRDECYVGVVRDITSKKELLTMKTRFLNVASHEIRVPLTVIRGYGRMLARDKECMLSEGQRECIDEIEKQCEKLLRFSNSLLDFAKIHSEKFALNRERVEVAGFVRGVVRNMQLGAREKKVEIAFRDQGGVDTLFIDPIRLEQALTNLIDNAIKHAPEGSLVTVDLSRTKTGGEALRLLFNQESAVISVQDQGPGIRSDEARDLFNDFFVGTSGRAKGGIGLGLAITREIIHAHGGQVEARASDKGGFFIITIPLKLQDY